MSDKLKKLQEKRNQLLKQIKETEQQINQIKNSSQKLATKYHIGEISYQEYNKQYKKIFENKTPQQLLNHHQIQIRTLTAQLDWYNKEIKKAEKKSPEIKKQNSQALAERINTAEKKKQQIIDSVQSLTNRLASGAITKQQYNQEIESNFGDKTPQQWVDYYDSYIANCQNLTKSYATKTTKQKTKSIALKFILPILLISLIIATFAITTQRFDITGLTVDPTEEEAEESQPEQEEPETEEEPAEEISEEEQEIEEPPQEEVPEEVSKETQTQEPLNQTEQEESPQSPSVEETPEETNQTEQEPQQPINETETPETNQTAEENQTEQEVPEEQIEEPTTPTETTVPTQPETEQNITTQETNITLPQNITSPPSLISEIPTLTIQKNSKRDLHVPDYFSQAEEYFLKQTENIATTTTNQTIKIKPDANFTGTRTSKIIVTNAFGLAESNEFNITVIESNQTPQTNLTTNLTQNISTLQYKAVIGRPVKWLKKIENASNPQARKIEIPKSSENISIKTGSEITQALEEIEQFEQTIENADKQDLLSGSITGNVARDIRSGQGILTRLLEWLKSFTITGNVVSENELEGEIIETEDSKIVDLDKVIEQTKETEIAIEYYTQAPEATEKNTTKGKQVIVSAPDELNYTDILAFTEIPEKFSTTETEKIKIFWEEEKQFINFTAHDADQNGFVDYLEWIVPHLSNQTYTIILVIKAEHLNTNRTFISDIFPQVSELDGNWSETIPENHFVRVTFERNLTNQNDITIYPRTISGTPQIEIYENNGTEIIAQFNSINDQKYNKVYLDDLVGEQDTFDLKILNGEIQFDHIIDPTDAAPDITFGTETPTNGSTQANTDIFVNLTTSDVSDHYTFTDFNNDLVLWMRFDDVNASGDPVDLSSNSRNGTLNGDIVINETGYFGNASHYDGTTDYINLGNDPSIQIGTHNYSFFAWVKTGVSGSSLTILADQPTGNNAFEGFRVQSHATVEYQVVIADGSSYKDYRGTSIDDDTWHHIGFTFSRGDDNLTMYLDGAPIEPTKSRDDDLTSSDISPTQPIYISSRGNLAQYWNGAMDEFLIFNRTLTITEVASLYNASANQYTNNFTGLPNADYSFTGYTADATGAKNQTETRTVTVDTSFVAGDNDNPTINFTNPTPANASTQTNTNIFVNLSTTDASTHYAFTEFDNDLQLWMRFDDVNSSGDPIDLSSNSYNATTIGNPVINETSVYGNASWLDGSDYYELGDVIDMGVADLSVCAWFYANQSQTDFTGIISKSEFSAANSRWGVYLHTNIVSANIKDSAGTSIANNAAGTTVTFNEWHHTCVVYDRSSSMTIYLNGTLDSTTDISSASASLDSAFLLRIGDYDAAGSGRELEGAVDDVLIFNRTLNLTEIQAIYNASANQYTNNFTDLALGTHSFTSYAVDSAGNKNQTETRTVTIEAPPDTTIPNINFTFPTPPNASTQENTNIFVNISSNDTNDHYSFVDFNSDLVLWLRMDDTNSSGDPIDLSSYSNNGSLIADALINTTGYFGNASHLDGTGDYIQLGDPSDGSLDFGTTESFTILAWTKTTQSANRDIIGKNALLLNTEKYLLSLTSGGNFKTTINDGSSAATPTGTATINDGNWHHLAASFNRSSNVTMYVDSVFDTTANISGVGNIDNANDLEIGTTVSLSTTYFNGAVDEILIFNRTLTQSEIASIYNASANQYVKNFENLTESAHVFTGYAVDSAGNKNQTETRTVTINSTVPTIDYVAPTPANGTIQNETTVPINISVTDTSDYYVLTNLDNDLQLWMRFDEVNSSGDPVDLSSYSRNGTLEGNAIIEANNYWGSGLALDGTSDLANITNAAIVSDDQTFTVSAWFKTTTSGTDFIYGESDVSQSVEYLGLYISAGKVIGKYSTTGAESEIVSASNYNDNVWHHAAYVKRSANQYELYIDGASVGSNSTSVTTPTGIDSSQIGTIHLAGSSFDFQGNIDEVIAFNRSLNETEVFALYNASANNYDYNFASLSNGVHLFTSHAVDKVANKNSTSLQITIDSQAPQINFTNPTPANASTQTNTNIFVNLTTSDVSDHYAFTDFNNDVVLWLRMDDTNSSGDPIDLSSYSNNGSLFADAFINTSGMFGSTVHVDGSADRVVIQDDPSLDFTNDISFSVWVQPAFDESDTSFKAIYDKRSGSGVESFRILYIGSGVFRFRLINSADTALNVDTSAKSWTQGDWIHLAGSYNGTNATIYYNGVSDASGILTGPLDTNNIPIWLGIPSTDNNINYTGAIDELILFNRSLLDTEIAALYNASANKYTNNFTNLNFASHTITGHAVDILANKNQTETRTITVQNPAPNVTLVQTIANQDPTENGVTEITFTATVSDQSGTSDITTVAANFTRSGEPLRQNSSCVAISGESTTTTQNYSCTIAMYYFDENGDWNITVHATDSNNAVGQNTTTTFQYNQLQAIVISPNSISFPSASIGAENVTSQAPTLINNTGNYNVANISVTGFNLHGTSQTASYISVRNVTVDIDTGSSPPAECNGFQLTNNTATNITTAALNRGNHSVNNGTVGQEQFYYCLTTVPINLPSQTYSTENSQAWKITILAVAFALGPRKKKKKSKKKILEQLSKKLKKTSIEELLKIEEQLNAQYGTTLSELLKQAQKEKQEIVIPIEIFKQANISPAEALSKYLKENKNLTYREIGTLLNRNERTIWINYNHAKNKKKTKAKISNKTQTVPLQIFRSRKLSIAETLINHLREKGMKNTQIAKELNKDPRNTWTIYTRATKKLDK